MSYEAQRFQRPAPEHHVFGTQIAVDKLPYLRRVGERAPCLVSLADGLQGSFDRDSISAQP